MINYLIEASWFGQLVMNQWFAPLGLVVGFFLSFAGFLVFDANKGFASRRIKFRGFKTLMTMTPFLCFAFFVAVYMVMQLEMRDRYTQDKNVFVDMEGRVLQRVGEMKLLTGANGVRGQFEGRELAVMLGRMSCSGSLKECNELLTQNQEEIVAELKQQSFAGN